MDKIVQIQLIRNEENNLLIMYALYESGKIMSGYEDRDDIGQFHWYDVRTTVPGKGDEVD